jgi:hypothetical protein
LFEPNDKPVSCWDQTLTFPWPLGWLYLNLVLPGATWQPFRLIFKPIISQSDTYKSWFNMLKTSTSISRSHIYNTKQQFSSALQMRARKNEKILTFFNPQ